MKRLFLITTLATISAIAFAMEQPATQEIALTLKDHILCPNGGHMRLVYDPANMEMHVMPFNGALEREDSNASCCLKNRAAGEMAKVDITKLCGLAQYKEFIVWAVLGTLHDENDILMVTKINNNQSSSTILKYCEKIIDVPVIQLTKEKQVVACIIYQDRKTKKYSEEKKAMRMSLEQDIRLPKNSGTMGMQLKLHAE